MKGNLARSGLCSFVVSVDFGLYSSIVGTRCDCCVRAIRGHSSAEPAASMLTKAKIVRQNFIRQLPLSKSRTIASHEQDMRLTPNRPCGYWRQIAKAQSVAIAYFRKDLNKRSAQPGSASRIE